MSKRKKILYWFFTLWMSLGMVSTGAVQLMKVKEGAGAADSMAHLGYPSYLLTLLGICKLLGVVAVLVPRFPLLKEWAYAGFFFVTAGAAYSHLAMGDGISDLFPSLLLLALTITSYFLRPEDRKILSHNA